MKPVRTVARVMLSAIFVTSGIKVLLDPDSKAEPAGRVTDRVGPWLEKIDPRLPSDTRTLVRIKAGADVVAGALLATGHLTRPAAGVLAATLIPTTVAGHPFWAVPKEQRDGQRNQFLKNLAMLGGLLLAAADTEGRPGLAYRTTHAVDRSQRRVKRAVRTARREAKIATASAAVGRKLG
jgi:putative oxidoreductase